MKRMLFKNILPGILIALWMTTCYYVCKSPEGFHLFTFWIMVGFPFGIHRMCYFLVPWNFDIAGSIGVLALNAIVGGIYGGFIVLFKIIRITVELLIAVCRLFIGQEESYGVNETSEPSNGEGDCKGE